MTSREIESILHEIGLPFRYDHFKQSEAVAPPFICWRNPDTDNFSADGVVYYKNPATDIEVYTDEKNIELEEKIENIFSEHGIYWEKYEQWIPDEEMYEVLYEI